MQKKILTSLLMAGFVLIGITGCQKKESIPIEPIQEEQVQGESQEEQIQSTEKNEGLNTKSDIEADSQTEAKQNDISSYDDYIASITDQSDILKTSLEQETLTQQDMNLKSEKLYELWDDVLNDLWGKLEESLPEEEFSKLLDEQRIWIAEKEKNVEEVGKEVEGGSMYSLVVNMEAARITEERVYELYELLK